MAGPETVELDAQYRQLREECGLVEEAERGLLVVSGAEAAEYLQGQLTNDVEALGAGDAAYAALLDRKGHMQADMRVLRPGEEPELLLDLEREGLEAARRHLQMYKIGREVEVSDESEAHTLLSLIGPRAVEIAGTAVLPEDACETTTISGARCVAVGTPSGIDLIFAAAKRELVGEALLAAGAVEVTPEAVEILRIETGRPRFGAEMGTKTMPAEAGIVEQAVSFTKGCYIGQETVARLHYKGKPNRRLRGLRFSGPVQRGEALRLDEKEVGTVGTSPSVRFSLDGRWESESGGGGSPGRDDRPAGNRLRRIAP
jgi:folate-binding protein YgfZ